MLGTKFLRWQAPSGRVTLLTRIGQNVLLLLLLCPTYRTPRQFWRLEDWLTRTGGNANDKEGDGVGRQVAQLCVCSRTRSVFRVRLLRPKKLHLNNGDECDKDAVQDKGTQGRQLWRTHLLTRIFLLPIYLRVARWERRRRRTEWYGGAQYFGKLTELTIPIVVTVLTYPRVPVDLGIPIFLWIPIMFYA